MKKWQILAPLGLALAGGAAVFLLSRKTQMAVPGNSEQSAKAAKPTKDLKDGIYSFISGYQNAATVEMRLSYDPDRYAFSVVSEDYLSYSSDSHVAILEGEDFSLQIEYAIYQSGEDADAQWTFLQEKHPDLATVRYGSVEGVRYQDGDSICFCFPIPEDAHSYLQVILFKAKGNDTELSDLPQDPEVAALLGSLSFTRT